MFVYVVFDSWKFEAFHLIILLCHFYLFQNGLMGLQTPKGWHFIKETNIVLHKILNWGFQNFRPIFFLESALFSVATLVLKGYLFELIFALLTFWDKE